MVPVLWLQRRGAVALIHRDRQARRAGGTGRFDIGRSNRMAIKDILSLGVVTA